MPDSVHRPDGPSLTDILEPHLSAARLAPYISAADGNRREAIRLYQWNIELSGTVYEALHVVEVVLRNAIDIRLAEWNRTQTGAGLSRTYGADWLIGPAPLIERLVRPAELEKARDRARRAIRPQNRPVLHDDILTQLTLGTWRYLLPDRDPGRRYLWDHAVKGAFPHLSIPAGKLVDAVDGIYKLRNRVAHLEPLLRPGAVRSQFENMRAVLRSIDPDVENWFVSIQRVTTQLRNRPKP